VSRGSPALKGPGLLLAAALACAGAAAQGSTPVEAGRARAAACMVCHGPLGISTAPDAPHLAGMPPIYFAAQLRAYRSGARKHEVMAVMARPLTDDDIANLAAWYSAIKIEASPP
jgi:cytochrome c553